MGPLTRNHPVVAHASPRQSRRDDLAAGPNERLNHMTRPPSPLPVPTGTPPGPMRRWAERLMIDRAVGYGMILRYWQLLAGPITVLLVVRFFTPEQQGYYYTFWSIVGLQVCFELALPLTILTTASHQWTDCRLRPDGSIEGQADNLSRLSHLTRTTIVLFGTLSVLFGLVVLPAGLFFFAQDAASVQLPWRAPWVALTLLSTLTFALIPLLAVLEGCGQVEAIYRMNLQRGVIGNLVVWLSIPLGAGLWVPAIATAVRLGLELWLTVWHYRRFFATVLRRPRHARLDWRREVWPFQSRLMLRNFFWYLNSDLMLPVVFRYADAAAAGRFGLTWTALSTVRMACSSLVRTRVPTMGTLIAKGGRCDARRLAPPHQSCGILDVRCFMPDRLGDRVWH